MVAGYIIHWLPSTTKEWYKTTFIKAPIVLPSYYLFRYRGFLIPSDIQRYAAVYLFSVLEKWLK